MVRREEEIKGAIGLVESSRGVDSEDYLRGILSALRWVVRERFALGIEGEHEEGTP